MNIINNKNLYKLDKFYREQLKSIEKDRVTKHISEEDYFRERLKRFNIDIISQDKKTKSKDDGVDFVINYMGQILICQYKCWSNSIGVKMIKEIFGDMHLSDIAIEYRKKKINIKYLLLCPFITQNCIEKISEYKNEDYYILYEEKFIEILLNPLNSISKNICKLEGYDVRNN